jgi:uncharacterized protein (TIGR02145 family)
MVSQDDVTRCGYVRLGNSVELHSFRDERSYEHKGYRTARTERRLNYLSSNFVRLVRTVDIDDDKIDVSIGKQQWRKVNLDTLTFANGDSILFCESAYEWEQAAKNRNPACCYFNFEKKGDLLYNYYAVADARGLSPKGYRIPSKDDFHELKDEIKSLRKSDALITIVDPFYWSQYYMKGKHRNTLKQSGFNARATGYISSKYITYWEGESLFSFGKPTGFGRQSVFWTLDKYAAFVSADSQIDIEKMSHRDRCYLDNGLSIRLIKD